MSIALVAFPLEKAYSSAFGEPPPTPAAGGGPNPSVDRSAQPPSVQEAWGPERPMYKEGAPAAGPALNSIVDNSALGDERIFLVFKNAAIREDGHWQRSGELVAGQTYVFRTFVNAAGADELKAADLQGVVTRVQLPNRVGGVPSHDSAGTDQYCGFLASSNAQPPQVWSCGVLLARHEVRLFPDPSSVQLYNNHFGTRILGPLSLGASIFTDAGQILGYDELNGHVPSGYRYALYLYFKVRVERA